MVFSGKLTHSRYHSFSLIGCIIRQLIISKRPAESRERKDTTNVSLIETVRAAGERGGQGEEQKPLVEDLLGIILVLWVGPDGSAATHDVRLQSSRLKKKKVGDEACVSQKEDEDERSAEDGDVFRCA